MKNLHKKTAIFIVAFLILMMFPTNIFAASITRYTLPEVDFTHFTSSENLLSGLKKIATEYPTAFTKSGEVCSKSHKNGEDNCMWFTPHQNYAKHNTRATQCFGYANYVYETLFGKYWDFKQYFTSDGTLASMNTGEKARREFERLGVSFGTIIRSTSAGHSYVILDYDEENVWIIHANYGGSNYGGCNTSVYRYTWSAYANAYKEVSYVIIPDSVCERCSYTIESFPECIVCGHRIGLDNDMYASYMAEGETVEYFIPFEGGQTEEIYSAGTEFIITGLFSINESPWAVTDYGMYIPAENLTFMEYLPSMEAEKLEYPDDYIVKGKSFWLKGNITSKNIITSLTVEILNQQGEAIDHNTITLNNLTASVAAADNLKFSKLSEGYYTFRLSATDASETKIFAENPFRVISDTTLKEAFPDKIFRQYVKEEIIKDEKLSDNAYADLYDDVFENVTEIDVSGMGISSVGEIHRFANLENLNVSDNHITSIDLSENKSLTHVDVSDQSVERSAEYSYKDDMFILALGETEVRYPRPDIFPKEDTVYISSGFGDVNMDINVKVTADMSVLCDADNDGIVNSDDLSGVLYYYGITDQSRYDVTFDGVVDKADVSAVLGTYGKEF